MVAPGLDTLYLRFDRNLQAFHDALNVRRPPAFQTVANQSTTNALLQNLKGFLTLKHPNDIAERLTWPRRGGRSKPEITRVTLMLRIAPITHVLK